MKKSKLLIKLIISMLIACMLICQFNIIQAETQNMQVEYLYNETTNTMLVNVKSENGFKPTKVNWTLSEDGKTYSYEFTNNTNYQTTFEDVLGNKEDIQIEFTQIEQRPLQLEIEYIPTENNSVVVNIKSNNILEATKINWTLSQDRLEYSYEFVNNTNYETSFKDVLGNEAKVQINVTQIEERPLELETEYIQTENNSVIVNVKSNNRFQDTKVNWTLQEDKMIYSYEFKGNTNYSTEFIDVFGNKEKVNIEISGIDETGPVLDIKYDYDFDSNSVKATITSNEEMKSTKKNWTLSEDKMVYTYVFTDNTNYNTSFEDKWGNSTEINIVVTDVDKQGPQITLQYIHNDDNSVTVNMLSDEQLKPTKKNWILSENSLVYSYTFADECDYNTQIEDLHGNSTTVHIKIKKKILYYTGTPNITVKYMYTSYEGVAVEMVSDVKFQDTKPSWTLSSDGYRYTKQFTEYSVYTTPVVDINGNTRNIEIIVDYFTKIIKCEEGTYGVSGLKSIGDARGSDLKYYKIGDGPNVFFATFSVHGFEDLYAYDGQALTAIAESFKNKLIEMQDLELDKKWTIYIFPSVNPDGEYYGWDHNGPGRTTLTSQAPTGQGIDLNRCWQIGSSYTIYNTRRNYNGTAGFQAVEASSLRDFLISHKSQTGQTVLVDLHGWLNETIGDNGLGSYYRAQYGISQHISSYGQGYLINWARSTLGARSVLVELPEYNANSTSYINATLNMLRSI